MTAPIGFKNTLPTDDKSLQNLKPKEENPTRVRLAERFKQAENKIEELKKQATLKDKDYYEIKSQLEDADEKIKSLKNQYQIVKEIYEKVNASNSDKDIKIMNLNNTIRENEEHLQTVMNELQRYKASSALLEGVFQPTSNSLKNVLTSLIPIMEEIEELGNKINDLRNKAEIIKKMINAGRANKEILEESLKEYDDPYYKLSKEYIELRPRADKTLNDLRETIKQATHKPIPEEYIKAISAKNNISLKHLESNDLVFEDLLEKCRKAYNIIESQLDHMAVRFDNATEHLNMIDTNLGVLSSDSYASYIPGKTYLMNWKSKERVSPTYSNFVKQNENMKGGVIETPSSLK